MTVYLVYSERTVGRTEIWSCRAHSDHPRVGLGATTAGSLDVSSRYFPNIYKA